MKISLLAAAWLWALPHLATAQVAILHIQVIEGEGTVNLPGARSGRPLAVEVTDETGKPVEGAAVSFHLPEDGPGGSFANGLRTDVTVTDGRGRASLHALQLNRTPGRLAIRIVAAKEQARAGMVTFQYIAEPKNSTSNASRPASRGALKWIVIAALAGGAAAAGALVAGRPGAAASASASSAATPTAIAISIGSPSITVGKP